MFKEKHIYIYGYYYSIIASIVSFILLYLYHGNHEITVLILTLGLWMGFCPFYAMFYTLVKEKKIIDEEFFRLD